MYICVCICIYYMITTKLLVERLMFLLACRSRLARLVVERQVGIPLCEGSCALAGSVALVMILYGASQWLNYDLFGLFAALH